MGIDFSQIFVQILGFLLMLWILKKFGWKPILEQLDARKEKIRAELELIENQKKAVDTLVEDYQNKLNNIDSLAREKIVQAVAEGQTIALEIQAKAQESIKDAQHKIQSNIHLEIEKAQGQLKAQIVQTVITTTEKLLNKTLKENEDQKLIEGFIEKVKLK